jgi:drug/metabolite transporter (DMT)-like permease
MSFVSLLVWFWLLRHYLASRLGVLTFLTPVIGVALGAVLLGEPLEAQFIAGAVVVLLGITTVSLHASVGFWMQRFFRPTSS